MLLYVNASNLIYSWLSSFSPTKTASAYFNYSYAALYSIIFRFSIATLFKFNAFMTYISFNLDFSLYLILICTSYYYTPFEHHLLILLILT
jgi:hypothetical protein